MTMSAPDPNRPWITDLLPADMRWARLMASAKDPAGVSERMSREPGLRAECLALAIAVPSFGDALAAMGLVPTTFGTMGGHA